MNEEERETLKATIITNLDMASNIAGGDKTVLEAINEWVSSRMGVQFVLGENKKKKEGVK